MDRGRASHLERAKGIEPSSRAWEALVLPLNYARERSEDTKGRSAGDARYAFVTRTVTRPAPVFCSASVGAFGSDVTTAGPEIETV